MSSANADQRTGKPACFSSCAQSFCRNDYSLCKMITPSVVYMFYVGCFFVQFCSVWNKMTIFYVLSKQKWMIWILLLYCPFNLCLLQKKVIKIFMNNAWALQTFNLFFSQFSFQNLIMKPFCISHMLPTFSFKKSLLIY